MKLDSSLHAVLDRHEREGTAAALTVADKSGIRVFGDRIRVLMQAQPGQRDAAQGELEKLGARIEMSYGDYLQTLLPLPALSRMNELGSIRFASQASEAKPLAISEGVALIGAAAWHSAGINGSGVKVAIIDLGFAGYQSRLGTELPNSLTTMNFRGDGNFYADEHGTAVAEIVYDIAPGAQYYLVAVDTVVGFGNAVNWVIGQGVEVVNFSAGTPAGGPGDGSGPWNQIVTTATNSGIVWANAAGNYATKHWGGSWNDPDADSLSFRRVTVTGRSIS